MKGIRRRDLLRSGAGMGLATGGLRWLTGCGAAPPGLVVPGDAPVDTPARVTAVRGFDLADMTRQVLDAVGGIGSVVRPGETVFIKPNMGGLGFIPHNIFTTGESTKVEIVVAVIEECLKAGADRVIVGEGGQIESFPWESAVTLDGSTNMAEEARRLNGLYPDKVVLACLEVDSPAWDPLPSPHTDLGEIHVSSLLVRSDRVISIAPLKTHRWTDTTLTMKNFVGTTPLSRYGAFNSRSGLHSAAGGVIQCFLDIVAAVNVDLVIVDASIGCEGNGPHVFPMWWGTPVDVRDRLGSWLLLAGTDAAAVDATATRIIGLDADNVPYLATAYEQGIGQIRADRIELVGATLDDLRMPWLPAQHSEGFGDVVLPTLLLKAMGLW